MKPVSVVFVAPRRPSTSELWMRDLADRTPGSDILVFEHAASDDVTTLARDSWIGRRWSAIRLVPGYGHRSLRAELTERRPEVVIAHYAFVGVRIRRLVARTGARLIVHVHGFDVAWGGGRLKQRAHRGVLAKWRFRRLARTCLVLTSSDFTRQHLVDAGVPASSLAVRTFGVEIPPSVADHASRSGVLFAGRLVDCKGPLETLEAYAAVADRLADDLTFAGDGPLMRTLRDRVEQLGLSERVHLLGALRHDDMLAALASARLVTTHSQRGPASGESESLGVVYLEAMAAATPILTGDHGGVAGLLERSGGGWMFAPGDIKAQSRTLAEVLDDGAALAAAGSRGRRYVSAAHGPTAESESVARLIAMTVVHE